jgi:hypothetical protein
MADLGCVSLVLVRDVDGEASKMEETAAPGVAAPIPSVDLRGERDGREPAPWRALLREPVRGLEEDAKAPRLDLRGVELGDRCERLRAAGEDASDEGKLPLVPLRGRGPVQGLEPT